jgi:hypothetical protein
MRQTKLSPNNLRLRQPTLSPPEIPLEAAVEVGADEEGEDCAGRAASGADTNHKKRFAVFLSFFFSFIVRISIMLCFFVPNVFTK